MALRATTEDENRGRFSHGKCFQAKKNLEILEEQWQADMWRI